MVLFWPLFCDAKFDQWAGVVSLKLSLLHMFFSLLLIDFRLMINDLVHCFILGFEKL